MPAQLDVNVLPLHRQDGYDRPSLPGVYAAAAPRRAARSRRGDRLVVFLSFEGLSPFSQDQFDALLNDLTREFFAASGSVTSALRALVERLNEALWNRNMRGAGGEGQIVGLCNAAVVREGQLYLAEAGTMHAFLLTPTGTRHLYDPETAGRGLGLSRTPPLRFFQADLVPGTLLVITPKIPSTWNESTLQGASGQSLATLRRRFLSASGAELKAVLLEMRPGRGGLNLIPSTAPLDAAEAAPLTPIPQPAPAPKRPRRETETQTWEPVDFPEATAPPIEKENVPAEERRRRVSAPAEEMPSRARRNLGPSVLNASRAVGQGVTRLQTGLRTLLMRMLPLETDFTLPPNIMALSAIVVPVIVATVAVVVYFQVGRQQQYDTYFGLAQNEAALAAAATEPAEVRAHWENSLFYVERAERYYTTAETQFLRQQAQQTLDDFDGVTRLEFLPAIAGTLSSSLQIRQMVATGTDLFMLDATSGAVLRARLTGTGYEMDSDFRCGPGPYGAYIVGPLVDLAPLPENNPEDAAIVAMDANGNLLYCIPDDLPLAAPLAAPDSNWGSPIAITVEDGDLYVLDPLTNAVWIYEGDEGQFREPPRFFFANEVPSLQGAIDFAISGFDLYLLYDDNHLTTCTFSSLQEAPTACTSPSTFTDTRPGREAGPQVEGARFLQIARTPPPEPSLFFLDPITRSVYHFSLRLNLFQQYRAAIELPEGLATAFAVSPNRSLFVALSNKVYIAFLP